MPTRTNFFFYLLYSTLQKVTGQPTIDRQIRLIDSQRRRPFLSVKFSCYSQGIDSRRCSQTVFAQTHNCSKIVSYKIQNYMCGWRMPLRRLGWAQRSPTKQKPAPHVGEERYLQGGIITMPPFEGSYHDH